MEAPAARFPVETKSDVCEIDQKETQLVISKFRYLNYLLTHLKLFNTFVFKLQRQVSDCYYSTEQVGQLD